MSRSQIPKIEFGYGLSRGGGAFEAGAEAARQALAGISQHSLSAVLVFASVRYRLKELLQGVESEVGGALVLGATTAGEICNAPQQESVLVVTLASPYLSLRVGLGQAVSRDWRQAADQAISAPGVAPFFSPQDSRIWPELLSQGKSAFGLLFSPGNTRHADSRSYEILEYLKGLSQGLLPLFGGSAADDWRMERNSILLGDGVYPDSLLVTVCETRLRFGIGLAHGFRPGSQHAVITRAQAHRVIEMDGQPAAQAYARLLGIPRGELEGRHLTLTTGRPVGMPDPYGQYSINVASYFTPQSEVRFSQPVPEGTRLTIMEPDPDDVIAAGREALRKALLRGEITDPAAILLCSCALRPRILKRRSGEEITHIQEMLPGVPVVGFYSFGEQGVADDGVNRHNNGVVSVLVLGRQLSYAAQVARESERLRQELKLSEQRYRLLVENLNDVIFSLDVQGRFTYVSPMVERLSGYRTDEILGQPFASFVHPDDLPALWDSFQRTLNGDLAPFEFRVLDKDGTIRLVRTSSRLLLKDGRPVGLTGIMADVTRRKRAEEDMRRAKEEWERTFDAVSDAILILDEQYRILRVNRAVADDLGVAPEEIVGRHCYDVFHDLQEPPPFCPNARLLRDGREHTVELYAETFDGYYLVTVSPMHDEAGRLIGSVHISRDITERKRMEEVLRESEQKFRRVIEQSREGIALIDEQGLIVEWNQAMEDCVGFTAAEMLGRPIWDVQFQIYPEELKTPQAYQQLKSALLEFCRTGQSIWTNQPMEREYSHPDGTRRILRGTVYSIQTDQGFILVGSTRDVTERVQTEKERQERGRFLALLNDITRAALETGDLQDMLQILADRLGELFGADGCYLTLWDEVARVAFPAAAYGTWRTEYPSLRPKPGETTITESALEAGQPLVVEDVYDTPYLSPRIAELFPDRSLLALPLIAGDQKLGAALVAFNDPRHFRPEEVVRGQQVAAQISLAVARARLVDVLQEHVAELEERNQELDAFAHTVAHDLKGPLAYTIGFADVLEQDYTLLPEEEVRGHLRTIARSGRKMSNIVDELLLLAEVRKIEVELIPLDMARVVADALDRLAHLVEERQVELILPPEPVWPSALGCGPWVEQVWVNYLSNAIHYGGQPPRIELGADARSSPSTARFWVSDNGSGLTLEEQGRLFTPFTRLDQARTKGHGLGLSIVRRIVEKMGGEVGVESQVGVGSTFWFSLQIP